MQDIQGVLGSKKGFSERRCFQHLASCGWEGAMWQVTNTLHSWVLVRKDMQEPRARAHILHRSTRFTHINLMLWRDLPRLELSEKSGQLRCWELAQWHENIQDKLHHVHQWTCLDVHSCYIEKGAFPWSGKHIFKSLHGCVLMLIFRICVRCLLISSSIQLPLF